MARTATCPHCGTNQALVCSSARDRGTIIGGMAGTAYMALRIIGRTSPVLTAPLLVASLLGLLWGAKAGRSIGETIDEVFPAHSQCVRCGADFHPI